MLGKTTLLLVVLIFSSYSYANDGFWEEWWDNRRHYKTPSYSGCNMDVYHNNTILLNPNYPQTYSGGSRCTYMVYRSSHRICQLRIDFLTVSLAQPTGDGTCATDYFTVEGGLSTTPFPRICGENTGQHVYVDVAGSLPASIIVATTASNTFNRRWQFRVTQIECLSKFRAPANCLQYYIQPSGFIRSFNYGMEENGNFNSKGVVGSREIANLQYRICIRTQHRMCSITYTRPTSDANAFSLTDDVKSVDVSQLGSPVLQSQSCTTDYIVIPAPSQIANGVTTVLGSDRFCGLGIGEIISRSLPFAIRVETDANENTDLANRGFYLNYRQGACL